MAGVVSNFRGSFRRKKQHQMIVHVSGVSNREKARGLIGKTVVWSSPAKNEIKGKVTSPNGSNGAVRVKFEKGLPGQSLGTEVSVE